MDAPTPITTFHLAADEAAYVEACLARRRELLALADEAPDGRVLARCEEAAVDAARGIGQQLLVDALARRVAHAEQKKSGQPGRVRVVGGDRPAEPTTGSS